jgi:uncharacterized protein YndB with AHSA1/START domain
VCRWARVLAFEPPLRIVFTWDISPQWQVETDLHKTSEVEVRFVSESPNRTRVELDHRNLERHGLGWESERANTFTHATAGKIGEKAADLVRGRAPIRSTPNSPG